MLDLQLGRGCGSLPVGCAPASPDEPDPCLDTHSQLPGCGFPFHVRVELLKDTERLQAETALLQNSLSPPSCASSLSC